MIEQLLNALWKVPSLDRDQRIFVMDCWMAHRSFEGMNQMMILLLLSLAAVKGVRL